MVIRAMLVVTILLVCMGLPALSCAADAAYTPERGTPERKEILDAVRMIGADPADNKPLDMIFVVGHFKVKGNWALIRTNPYSSDRMNAYEPIDALLQKIDGKWTVVEVRPCCGDCEDDPDCPADHRYFRKLMKTWPEAPADIFPKFR